MAGWLLAVVLVLAAVPADPPVDPTGRGYLGIRMGLEQNLQIGSVVPNTPAEKAGLQSGDVLVKVGTLTPDNFDQVVAHVKAFRPGSELKVDVRRGGAMRTVTIRLMARPASADVPGPRIILP